MTQVLMSVGRVKFTCESLIMPVMDSGGILSELAFTLKYSNV